MLFTEREVAACEDVEMTSPEVSRQTSRDSTKTTSPLTVSSGIMTKRGPIVEEVKDSIVNPLTQSGAKAEEGNGRWSIL